MSLVLLAIFLFVVFYYLPRFIKYIRKQIHMRNMVRGVPGPKAHPIYGNLKEIPMANTEWSDWFVSLGKEWIPKGRNTIPLWIFTQLKIDILDSTDALTKSDDYDIIERWLGTGLLIATGEKWKHRRRILTPTFHFQMLENYIKCFNRESKILADILATHSKSEEKFDMHPYVKRCTLDIICDTAMGIRLGSQEKRNHPYAVTVDDFGYLTNGYLMRPWLWLQPIFYLSGWRYEFDKTIKILTDFTKEVIAKRVKDVEQNGFKEDGKRKAFLDMLLEMKIQNSLTDEDIREEVDAFMWEGQDTVSSGIAWIIWCLATHQDVQQKVADELQDIFGDSDRDITIDDLKQMTYFERVIKESMRVNPPVPFVSRRLDKDMKIGCMMCPAGAMVVISPLIIHRNEQVYPDPLKFDPDRFLPENTFTRRAFDYIPFSAGARNCIGQKFAMHEQKVVVAWLVRRFKIYTDKHFDDNCRIPEIVLKPHGGLVLKLSPRN